MKTQEKQLPNLLRMAEEKLDSYKLVNDFIKARQLTLNHDITHIINIVNLESSFIKSNYNLNRFNLLNSLSISLSYMSRQIDGCCTIEYFDKAVTFVNKITHEHDDIFDKLMKGYINEEYQHNRSVYCMILAWIVFYYMTKD